MTDGKSLQDYRALIQVMLDQKLQQRVANSCPSHASIVLEEMVRHAKESFVSLSNALSCDVWTPSVVAAIEYAGNHGIDITLVIEGKGETDIPQTLKKYTRVLPPNKDDRIHLTHCAAMDGTAYRIETDREKRKAFFCANDEALASKVKDVVQRLAKLGKAYE